MKRCRKCKHYAVCKFIAIVTSNVPKNVDVSKLGDLFAENCIHYEQRTDIEDL